MAITLAIIYFILAGVCWKDYKETDNDNCQFGVAIFALVGILILFLKFFW